MPGLRRAGGRRTSRALAALAALALSVFAAPALAEPAMWVVRDADSEIYLFGTVHMLRDDAQWRTPVFDAIYERADAVWFETRVDADPAETRALMAKYAVDPDNRLTGKLSPRAIKSLKPLLRKEKIPIEALDNLRPWAAAMMLSVQPMQSRGYAIERGADAVITRAAEIAEKPVRTFESFEDQVRFLAELPEEAAVQYLEDVIDEQANPGRESWTLQQAWTRGDIDILADVLVGDMRRNRPQLYDVLLGRRNEAWAKTLAGEMSGSGVQLVNVGALHMVGKHGLPALMRAYGFTVERVQ